MTDKNHSIFEFDDVRVEPSKFKIWKAREELVLEPKTFQVLIFLLENRGRLIEKNELLEAVWKDTFVTENAMTREIAKLRKALADDPKTPKYIQTVHTQGYRFIAEVGEMNPTSEKKNESPIASHLQNADRATQTENGPENIKKRRTFAVKLVVLGCILAIIAAVVWLILNRQRSSNLIGVQKTTQLTIWPGLDDFPAISPDGKFVAYCSDHDGSFEIYVKSLAPGAKEIQVTSDGGQNFQPAFSPDGQLIVYYSKQRGGIWVIPASGGNAKQLAEFGSHPAWSPDGKQIVFQSNPISDLGASARNALPPSTLWLIATGGGEPRQLTQLGNPAGGHGAPSFSPDSKRIAFEVNDYNTSSIWTISVDGQDAKPILLAEPRFNSYQPVYTPDGKSIFFVGSRGLLQVNLNPEAGEPTLITGIAGAPSFIRRVNFSADGKKMVYNVMRRFDNISSVSVQATSGEATSVPVALIVNGSYRNNFNAFSPDGKRVAFSSCNAGGGLCDIWLADADGSNQIQLTTAASRELMPDWMPDNKEVTYVSNRTGHHTYWAMNLETKREQMLFDFKGDANYVKLSPDGKKVAFNFTQDGVINLWTASLAGGNEQQQLTFDKELAGFPVWSPDGKWLAFQIKRGDETNIYIIPSEGGSPEQLTFEKGQSWAYGWSPDGNKILFAGQRNGFWNVYWVLRTTKKIHQLTDYKKLNSFVRYPSWSPIGSQIAYEYSETTGNIWVADLE